LNFNPQSTFMDSLPADANLENYPRQVLNACYSFTTPRIPSNPRLIHYSEDMMNCCGLTKEFVESQEFLDIVSGAKVLENTKSYAMCYGGHQFGHWAGQLGDGRAINLFEHSFNGNRFDFQLKGAGLTPYSRTADGLAVLRSSVREYLCSEAMHHLGIKTTRAISLVTTGDEVWRDIMYDGHPAYEFGAIVCRVAESFIRFGSFEILSARKDFENLKKLTDYTIDNYYPHIETRDKAGYLQFFKEISELTLDLMIDWQRVGFVHGVMNTDNMSILGLTIDYGPYGWLEGYDPTWTPNTTDAQGKRYRYENQPDIGLWNLLQLANALYPLIEDIPALESILATYHENLAVKYQRMMADKLGLVSVNEQTNLLISDLESVLQLTETDFTIFFRNLSKVEKIMTTEQGLSIIHDAFYKPEELSGKILNSWKQWLDDYLRLLRLDNISDLERKTRINTINPKYVLRNYMAQMAIEAAEKGDNSVIDELYKLLLKPYDEQNDSELNSEEKWFAKRPEWARTKIGCSMLSCSS
jgi:serine/tyrosine/threonine adenylyltransferase